MGIKIIALRLNLDSQERRKIEDCCFERRFLLLHEELARQHAEEQLDAHR
jgi:hypothetical protein